MPVLLISTNNGRALAIFNLRTDADECYCTFGHSLFRENFFNHNTLQESLRQRLTLKQHQQQNKLSAPWNRKPSYCSWLFVPTLDQQSTVPVPVEIGRQLTLLRKQQQQNVHERAISHCVGDPLCFLFQCPTYIDIWRQFIPRTFLQPQSGHIASVDLCFTQREDRSVGWLIFLAKQE